MGEPKTSTHTPTGVKKGADAAPGHDWADIARQAAEAGDPVKMLEALHLSRFLDGLVRLVRYKWNELDEDEADMVVAQSVDAFYARASAGERIREPKGYLYRTSQKLAYDEHYRKARHFPFDESAVSQPGNRSALATHPPVPRGELRRHALEIARKLLPRLGQQNIQRVMAYVFDAVEKEVEDLPAAEVAEALGLSNAAVRQCICRGFKRLKRVAREEGISLEETLERIEEQLQEEENQDDDNDQ